MTEGHYCIRTAEWPAEREALGGVREVVFVREQGVPLELEWDDGDVQALHLLAVEPTGEPIATARMLPDGHIGRMAVLPGWRGRGIGSALLLRLLDIALERGLPAPFLNAQTQAMGFYQRFGFQPEGAEFLEAGIPHRRMIRR